MYQITYGNLCTNIINSITSPVTITATNKYKQDPILWKTYFYLFIMAVILWKNIIHLFILNIIECGSGLELPFILSCMAPVNPSMARDTSKSISPKPSKAYGWFGNGSSRFTLLLSSFCMNNAMPTTTMSMAKYLMSGYFLPAISTPNSMTGTGFIDLPITWVGYETCWRASLLASIATRYVRAHAGYIHFLVVAGLSCLVIKT